MSKIAIFASGKGSNAKALLHYFNNNPSITQCELLLTNKQNSGVFDLAADYGVSVKLLSNEEFETGNNVLSLLQEYNIDFIVLAGFLRKIPSLLIQKFPDRILNIHPSLLPKYGGKGMYGNKVHQAVKENKESESGISIHLVNQNFDEGRILHQAKCAINDYDTIEQIAEKIHQLEHKHFPKVVEEYIKSYED